MATTKFLSKTSKLAIAPLLVACIFLVSACDSKESNAIKIEGQIVSKTGSSADKAAIDTFLQEKQNEVQKLAKHFSSHLAGNLSVDASKTANAPNLVLDGKPLNQDHSIPDKLSAQNMGAVATIFVRSGDDFIRISTSLKKTDGGRSIGGEDRAVNSTLSHNHPGYKTLLVGEAYTGTANLFGSIYMTQYTPIKDVKGAVIGLMFVGVDITGDIALLARKLQKQ